MLKDVEMESPSMWLSAQNTEGRQKQVKLDLDKAGTHDNLFNSSRTVLSNQLVSLLMKQEKKTIQLLEEHKKLKL